MGLKCLRENPWSLLLTAQTLVEEHASISNKWPSAFGQDQPFIAYFDQAIIEHRIKERTRILSLLWPQLDFEASHKRQDLFAQAPVFLRKQMPAKSGNFSLAHSTLIHRKSLFVLMKASWCFGNRTDSETQ